MFMAKEEVENNLKELKVDDKVVLFRESAKSSKDNELYDYIEGRVRNITEKTVVVSFNDIPSKRVLKSSIVSLMIKE